VRSEKMASNRLSGKVQTVLGPVSPESLGITLIHEHLLVDISCAFSLPEVASERALAYEPLGLENLWWVRQHWTSNLDNLRLLDETTAIAEAERFKRAGGQTVVDVTSTGVGRDPCGLARISRATGLHVLMGSGYYTGIVHPPDMDRKTEDEIAREIIRDVTVGVAETRIRAGLIGEIGCSWPWQENERKAVRAAAHAQLETGAALMVHPGRDVTAPLAIVRELERAGAVLSRTIMCHMERTITDIAGVLELAATGVCLEYDLFGHESSFYPPLPIDMPNDAQRLAQLEVLIIKGHLKQILISQDVCTKHRLTRYGGHGYDHLLRNVVPCMRRKGFTEEHIWKILMDNPQRLLCFV
jgi:phosphotriesterase-related protein